MLPRFAAFLCCAFILLRCLPALACAPVWQSPERAVVITDESAVIVWDEKKHEEHFIRTATFRGATKDVGFIVPSPTVPKLREANISAFDILKKAIEPPVVDEDDYDYVWGALGILSRMSGGRTLSEDIDTGRPGGIEILQSKSVAGYDATTLKASDSGKLNQWLSKNGYVSRPDFAEWLNPYVKKGWVITAFKIKQPDKTDEAFSSSLVRMSFKTDKPFFPYREPASQREGKANGTFRSLRVFFIGSKRMEGGIGNPQHREWPGMARWSDNLANHIDGVQQNKLISALGFKVGELPSPIRLTTFEEFTTQRPGIDDVYFQPSANQDIVMPPPIVHRHQKTIFIPIELILAFVVAAVVLIRRRNKVK